MEDNYEKFEDLEIVDSREVWWATTLQLECEWNGKKFTVRDAETSKSRERRNIKRCKKYSSINDSRGKETV